MEELGRAAQLGQAQGVPANVIPVALWHTASIGIDLWLSAIAFGASQVAVLATGEEAPQYLDACGAQMEVAQAILNGLGYAGTHFQLLRGRLRRQQLDQALQPLAQHAAAVPAQRGALRRRRRKAQHARAGARPPGRAARPRAAPEAIALPRRLALRRHRGRQGQVHAVPELRQRLPGQRAAGQPAAPQLRFVEKNCVQCGLCATTCPEDAITLQPRLLLTPERKAAAGAQREPSPTPASAAASPSARSRRIEAMLGKLAGHSMFQGAALERLKMCGDCRVIDIYSADRRSEDHRPMSEPIPVSVGARRGNRPRRGLWPAGPAVVRAARRRSCWPRCASR